MRFGGYLVAQDWSHAARPAHWRTSLDRQISNSSPHRFAGIDVINQQDLNRTIREISCRLDCIGFYQLRYGGKKFRCRFFSELPCRIIIRRLVRSCPSYSDATR